MSFLCWNIAGWRGKKSDPDFLKFVNLFQVILLQETWEEEVIDINGYDTILLPASPSLKGGRPRGGLVIAISLKLQAKLTLVKSFSPYAITGLISGGKFELLVTNVYFPPGGQVGDLHSKWETLEEHLAFCYTKFPNTSAVMGGDFNARTAANWEALGKAKWWVIPDHQNLDLSPHIQRKSKDNRVNEAGTLLYQLILRLNLIILNGNCPPDIPGEFTHLSTLTNSVLDYFIVSRDLFPNFSYFKIENVQMSDHLPLSAKLSLDWQSIKSRHPIYMGINNAEQVRGIKWSVTQAQKYMEFFQQEIIQTHAVLDLDLYGHEQIINSFSLLTEDLMSFFTVPAIQVNRALFKTGAPWFNLKCKQARRHLCAIYNEYKSSGALVLPRNYQQAKIAYKQAQRMAKQEWQQNRWQALIIASSSRNSRQFWQLINRRSRRYPLTIIPAPVWESFLRKYFASPDPNTNVLDDVFDHLPIWPPTDPDEILNLISKLKIGKAPGPDLVPAEAIKLHSDWWAKILAVTFDAINATGRVPKIWKDAIIIPIYKKGSPDDPENYRNISLLSIVGKIYARFLLNRLTQWAEEKKLIGPEQAGFRPNQSTTDHVLVLHHLAQKYSSSNRGQLCAAFIDLKAAFDSIPRRLLWEKLARWGIDRRLLWLIIQLHEGSAARVRITPAGDLTNSVPINRGVRQGCILAPFLFNLFISDMRIPLAESQEIIHAPRLANYRCPLLLYADDAVILSFSRIGLRRALKLFVSYCKTNSLTINQSKSKVLIFSKSRKSYKWQLDGKPIEQVYKFQYLGVFLQYNLGWKAHIAYVLNKAKALSFALLRFFFSDGALHVPSALKVFKAKVIATLAYAVPLWGTAVNLMPLEVIQNQFLRRLLKLPQCVSNAAIRLELKTTSLENTLWRRSLCYWLSLRHRLPNLYLIQCLWRDNFPVLGAKEIHSKVVTYGLSPSELLELDLATAKKTLTQKLEEIDLQQNTILGSGTCSPLNLGIVPSQQIPSYLTSLSVAVHRYAFIKARFNAFPSNVLNNRFSNGQISAVCVCDNRSIESLQHILFCCPLHSVSRIRFLSPLLLEISGDSLETQLIYLLQDSDPSRSLSVARFLITVLAYKRKNGLLYDY